MSKRGLMWGLVALLVAVSFSGCLGDDADDVDANGSNGSGDGGMGAGNETLDVNATKPTAAFSVILGDNQTNATVGVPIDFNASASADPDGENLTYAWDFGDNTTGEGIALNHTFEAAGNYTVVLTVTDESGLTDATNQTLVVDVGGPTGPGTLYEASGSLTLPNPLVNFYSNAGLSSLSDHESNTGAAGTTYDVHTITDVPENLNELRFKVEFSSPDGILTGFGIRVFPADGSAPIASSTYPSGSPDVTLTGDDLGESTYHAFIWLNAGAAYDYDLTVTFA